MSMETYQKVLLVNVLLLLFLGGIMMRCQVNEMQALRNEVKSDVSEIKNEMDVFKQEYLANIAGVRTEIDQNTVTMQQWTRKTLEGVEQTVKDVEEQQLKTTEELIAELELRDTERQAGFEDLQNKINSLSAENGDFTEIINEAVKSTVNIRSGTQVGTGIVVNGAGFILTNYHIVRGSSQIQISFPDGRRVYTTVFGFDETLDLAVLRPKSGLGAKPATFANSENVQVGDKVIAIGNPGGFKFSVSQGIVSATDRFMQGGVPLFQIDVAINPGNSGGPLIDTNGNVIGVNAGFTALEQVGLERMGFSIKSNVLKQFLQAKGVTGAKFV